MPYVPKGHETPLTSEELADARAWLSDCAWANMDPVGLDVRTGDDLGDGIDRPAGWYRPSDRTITVNAALPAAARAACLAHELAHHVAGRLERRDAETVAEGAAFAVAAYFGLDTAAWTVPYVAGWAQDLGRVRALLESIAAVSDDILGGLAECYSCAGAGCEACMV